MFDLEQAIAGWRKQMLAAGIKTPVPLEGLESHLRDEIERQLRSGLSELQAFESGVRQIGVASAIQNEFNKIGETIFLTLGGASTAWCGFKLRKA